MEMQPEEPSLGDQTSSDEAAQNLQPLGEAEVQSAVDQGDIIIEP